MSKKKLQRAVMTLKDFHGGSIPSDLPLPSAPGMSVERISFDRQGSGASMSPVGRGFGGGSERSSMSQNRQGLGSSGVRAFEDKASLFPNTANIGRNYDEDERSKPVDGYPRSSSTEQQQSMYPENMEQVGYAQADVSQTDRKLVYGESYGSSRGADSNDGIRSGFGERHIVGESTRVQGGYPDTGGYVHDSGGDGLNGNGAIGGWGGYQDPGRRMKFFDKGRIGRVESDYTREPSDPRSLQQADRGIRAYNPGVGNDNHALDSGYGASLPERNPNSSNPHEIWTQQVNWDQGDRASGGRSTERQRSPPLVESNQAFVKERSVPSVGGYLVGISQIEAPSSASGPQVPLVTPEPVAERPKLKLLPRSKPLEMNEAVEHIGSERRKDELTTEGKVAEAVDGSGHLVKGPSSNFESGDLGSKLAERPKLNLKPRSQPLEEGAAPAGSDRIRDSIFGGARPREFVLRARGANDISTMGEDCIPSPPSLHIWGDEKQVRTQSFEHQAEGFMESQGPGFRERKVSKQDWVAPSNHLGNPEWKSRGDFDKQDNPGQYEVNHTYNHHSSHSHDPDRQELALHDLHKTDSWHRPASPNPPTSAVSTPFNNSSAPVGHHSFNAPASPLELAKAFSRSSSIGSSMAGFTQSNSGNQRGPLNLISRSQSYGPGFMNGNGGGYGQQVASFSCLAEAGPSPPMNRDVYAPGSGYGGNRPYDRFGSAKNTGGFCSGVGAMNSRLSHG
ncbi:unnamed protein product [Sphagnum balticum]